MYSLPIRIRAIVGTEVTQPLPEPYYFLGFADVFPIIPIAGNRLL